MMAHEQLQQDAAEVEFRSLSPLAAVSLILALVSPTALASPVFLFVPAAAVLFGLLALAKIRSAEGGMTGVGFARMGLAIGLACLAATIVRDPVRDALMRRQARDVAKQWMTQLAEGQISEALTLMSAQAQQALGPKPGSPDAAPPKPEDARIIELSRLRADKVTVRLASLEGPLQFEATPAPGSWPVFDGGRTLIMEDFKASSAAGGRSVRVQVRMARTDFYESEGRPWRVDSWQLIDDQSADARSG